MEKEKLLLIISNVSEIIKNQIKQYPANSYAKGFCDGQLDSLDLIEKILNDNELLEYLYGGMKK